VKLATSLTRRAAVLAPILTAIGIHNDAEADECTQRCKLKGSKKKKKKCIKKCKKQAANQPSYPRTASFNGVGPTITSSFRLAAGRYRISGTHTDTGDGSGNFIVHLWGPQGYEGYIFNELEFDPGTFSYQVVEEVPYSGTYFYEVQYANSNWTISMSPI
jgi:hypothetical protein